MNLEELEAAARMRIKDANKPYLRPSSEIWDTLNEAEQEAAARADLLPESSDTDYTEVPVTAGTASYAINAKWTRISHATFTPDGADEDPIELRLLNDPQELDALRHGWRTNEEAPRDLIVQGHTVRFGCLPDTDGTLTLEGFRLPNTDMTGDADEPEIAAVHHRHLVDWAEYRGLSKPDPDREDPVRAQAALERFEAYFGPRRDARHGQPFEGPQHVKAW